MWRGAKANKCDFCTDKNGEFADDIVFSKTELEFLMFIIYKNQPLIFLASETWQKKVWKALL